MKIRYNNTFNKELLEKLALISKKTFITKSDLIGIFLFFTLRNETKFFNFHGKKIKASFNIDLNIYTKILEHEEKQNKIIENAIYEHVDNSVEYIYKLARVYGEENEK